MLKFSGAALLTLAACAGIARADLTIVQKVEGAGPVGEMTIKIKGDKARIDATPQLTSIVDGKTGEMTNLMRDQKAVVRISAEKMKAAVEMMNKYNGNEGKPSDTRPKLVPTGKKEKMNGYDVAEYLAQTASYKASYWIAVKYPDAQAILNQLQGLNPQMWSGSSMGMPDYREFPGVPIKTVVSIAGNEIVTTLVSIKQEPVSDSEFAVPKDYKEIKPPEIGLPQQGREDQPPAR